MKRFFVKIAILCIPLIALLPLIVLLFPLPENAYDLAIIDKHRILENTEGARIVLAGGSNLAFGIDSAAIQDMFNMPVINLGVHAGFGLGRILDDISPFLHRGDILLIAPEYDYFTGGLNGGKPAFELIFDVRQHRLLFSSKYGLPSDFSGYLSDHLKTVIARYVPPNPKAYSRDGFNEYGDYVKHLNMENRPIASAKELGSLNISYLNHFFQFIDDFTARGITVALSYPSYEEQSWRNSAALIQELDKAFRAKENLLVISCPESYSFPTRLFYDTTYHLNAEGRTRRTEQLLEDLRASGIFGK
jgi:hypothetical protein